MPTFFNDNSQAVKQQSDLKQEMSQMKSDIQNLQEAVRLLADEGSKEIDSLASDIQHCRIQLVEAQTSTEVISNKLRSLNNRVVVLTVLVVGVLLGCVASIIFR